MMLEQCSYAKVNLWLNVRAKRPDGYHELETLFLPVASPADTVRMELSAASGIRVSSSLPGLPSDSGNICFRAAEAYLRATGMKAGLDIYIDKHIPVAAGLGGGSGNAAVVLSMLNTHFRAMDGDSLSALALTLGADVPFFLQTRPAVGRGVGEQLEFLDFDCRDIPLLIIAPDFPVSAAWAYKNLMPDNIRPREGLTGLLAAMREHDWTSCGKLLHNDLAAALRRKFPIISMLLDSLMKAGAAGAEVSGSGPSLFAVFPDTAGRDRAAASLPELYDNKIRCFVPGGCRHED